MTSLLPRISAMTRVVNDKLIIPHPEYPEYPENPIHASIDTGDDAVGVEIDKSICLHMAEIIDDEAKLKGKSYDENSADSWSDCGDCSSASSDSDYDGLLPEPYEESEIIEKNNSISSFLRRCCFPNTQNPPMGPRDLS